MANSTYTNVSDGNEEGDLSASHANYGTENNGSSDANNFNDANNYVSVNAALQQEKEKYKSDKHSSKYAHNPTTSNSEIDLRKKNNINHGSFGSVTKRIYRKIERISS